MKVLRLFLILLVLFVSHLMASAQYSFRLINASQGLPDDEVKALFWTPDGRLCVRTSSSLSFFDGCTFRSVPPMGDEAYTADYVSALSTVYVDARQRVWIKELGKFLVFDLTRDAYVRDVRGLLASMGIREKVRDFFIDSEKDLWFVTASGKMLMVKASKMKETSKIGEAEMQCQQMKIRTRGLRDVCSFGGNHWFLYSDGWVIGMNASLNRIISSERVWKGEVPVRDFMQFAQNQHQLWLMWNHGVASYLPKEKRWQQQYSDEFHTFTTLAVSSDGKVFLGVRQLGLVTIEPNGKQSLQASFPIMNGALVADDIQSIAYERGNLVLGFYYKGMALYNANMQGFPFYAFRQFQADGLGFYRASCTSGGNVCLAFPQQVLTFNPYRKTLQPLQGTGAGDDFIQSFTDSRGRVWVGTFRKGIYLKDGDKVSHFMQENVPNKDLDYNIVRDFAEDHLHQIWVCYHGGVGRFDEQSKRIFPLQNKLFVGNTNINSVVFDRQHRLWAATNSGQSVEIESCLQGSCH